MSTVARIRVFEKFSFKLKQNKKGKGVKLHELNMYQFPS